MGEERDCVDLIDDRIELAPAVLLKPTIRVQVDGGLAPGAHNPNSVDPFLASGSGKGGGKPGNRPSPGDQTLSNSQGQ